MQGLDDTTLTAETECSIDFAESRWNMMNS